MKSDKGKMVPNQFIINGIDFSPNVNINIPWFSRNCSVFQSYDSIIAIRDLTGRVLLDEIYWNYSNTTSRYRNKFLGETTKETQSKIDSGEYKLVNLNG